MAAGTCVARVLGAEMTGDPAMLASGCEEDIEVMPRKERKLISHLEMLIFTRHLHLNIERLSCQTLDDALLAICLFWLKNKLHLKFAVFFS